MPLKWACGVTTAPRPGGSLLYQTIESIRQAGFQNIVISTEEEDEYPEDCCLVFNDGDPGPWHNLRSLLKMLTILHGDADAYVLFQDDIIVSKNCREYLDSVFSRKFQGANAIYSLYTAMDKSTDVLFPSFTANTDLPMGASGALGYVIPASVTKRLLANPPWPERAKMADISIGEFCRREGVSLLTHNPSLVAHMGEKSTCNHYAGMNHSRQCKHFMLDCRFPDVILSVNGQPISPEMFNATNGGSYVVDSVSLAVGGDS